MNWIWQNVVETVANILDGLIETINIGIIDLYENAAQLPIDNANIVAASNTTSLIAVALISLAVSKRVYSTYIGETEGDSESDPLNIIEAAAIGIAIIVNNNVLYKIFIEAAKNFGGDLINSMGDIDVDTNLSNAIAMVSADLTPSHAIEMIYIALYVIGIIWLCVKGGMRGAELSAFTMLLPFFCADIISTKKERFTSFITSYIVTMFGYALQIFFFRISGNLFASYASGQGLVHIFEAAGFLYLSIKGPKWLEKYIYSSGVGQTVTGASTSMMHIVPAIMR